MPLFAALVLAIWAEALFLLAAIGQLRPIPIAVLAVLSVVGCLLSGGFRQLKTDNRQLFLLVAFFIPIALLALHPPLAFDETLYHLPTVRALATSGQLRYVPDLRFPVFPQFQELLCVPVYLLAGDTATHLVSLVEMLITAALLLEWSGWLAAAFFLGGPIVVHLATVGYVDAALTLFVTAGFFCIHRERFSLAGFFLGVACGVKYHGGYFAAAALLYLLIRERRAAWKFAIVCAAAALPTTLWILIKTGNPFFPFFDSRYTAPHLFGFTNPWRLLWDATFARARVNFAPPMTPLLIPAVLILIVAATRDARARAVALLCAGYLALFSILPQDTRYLVPLLPLLAVVVAAAVPYKRWLVWLAIAPGILYAGYRLTVIGLPPADREAFLARHVPEYRAVIRAGTGAIYVCGGEQLKSYARGRFLGDFFGPYAYEHVLDHRADTASIASSLRSIRADYYLVAKRVCAPPRATGGMDLVYEDSAAQLWHVQPSQPALR